MMRRSMIKRFVLAVIGGLLMANAALAATDDEDFVRIKANEALAILSNDALTHEQKTDCFRDFVEEISDVPRVARFVLGKYARGVDPVKLENFTTVFRQYATGVYESRLGSFGGETLMVTGSKDRKPGDSVVSTVINGGQLAEPLDVNWRIQTRKGKKQVLDVQVFGIWLALHQRNEITSVIANNNGDVDAATSILETRITNADFGQDDEEDEGK